MMKKLSQKFLFAYLLFELVCFLIFALLGERLFRQAAIETAASELYSQTVTLAEIEIEYFTASKQPDLNELTRFCTSFNLRALMLDSNYQVIFDSEGSLTGQHVEGFNPAESTKNYRVGDLGGLLPQDKITAFAPISVGTRFYAYLLLSQNLSVPEARAKNSLLQAYLIYLAIFAASLILLVAVRYLVLKPVRTITEGAKEFAAGNMKHRIDYAGEDELADLARSLNDMAGQIQSSDETQRRFIANVAHDFRSPLTSIKGYLEAMVDGVIPAENQEKYMNIIIGETERLTNLTQSMLSLNSLDEARRGLELSRFDMVELVRSVSETFEVVCSRRGISFDLIFGASSLFVKADHGRISQALHNLIDNAIKFSFDKGLIRIQVQKVGEKVSVSVKDFGQGIPKEDLSKIWTRFYKGDASRGKDKRGTGLGLSITREIITAHGETIDVASTPGSGTEFVFRLPLARG